MRKVNAFVHEQIGNMAHFKHQLQLKLSLNQQLIEKDQEAWEAHMMKTNKKMKELDKPAQVLDKDVQKMILAMQRVVARIEQPYEKWKQVARSGGVPSIKEKQMNNEIMKLEMQQAQDMERATDCLRSLMEAQSIAKL